MAQAESVPGARRRSSPATRSGRGWSVDSPPVARTEAVAHAREVRVVVSAPSTPAPPAVEPALRDGHLPPTVEEAAVRAPRDADERGTGRGRFKVEAGRGEAVEQWGGEAAAARGASGGEGEGAARWGGGGQGTMLRCGGYYHCNLSSVLVSAFQNPIKEHDESSFSLLLLLSAGVVILEGKGREQRCLGAIFLFRESAREGSDELLVALVLGRGLLSGTSRRGVMAMAQGLGRRS